MLDRDKVIKGLTHCTAWGGLHECQPKAGDDCPYEDEADCKLSLMCDALALLKERAAVPVIQREFMNMLVWCCGSCGVPITNGDKFCRMCGKEVKWDA